MLKLCVTATNTNIGKTYTTKLLLKELASRGYRVCGFKPIETGVVETPLDGSELLQLSQTLNPQLSHLHVNDIVPLQFMLPASPFVANNAQDIDLHSIDTALLKLEPFCDIVVIEGAGGLMVPIDSTLMMIDLIKHFDTTVVLVSHCDLGCINDTLLSLNILQQQHVKHLLALNCKNTLENFNNISKPYFEAKLAPYYLINSELKALVDALLKN
jgi:dethiobiotin synthetase